MTGARQHKKKQEKRKAANTDVLDAERLLSENSLSTAWTPEDVAQRQEVNVYIKPCFSTANLQMQVARSTRNILRDFYHSKRNNQTRHQEIETWKTYRKLAAEERRFLQEDGGSISLLCTGLAGTGVGSTIKGYARRGSRKLRDEHRQHGIVALVNEYHTSLTCPFCLDPIIHPKAMRNRDNKKKTINGASVCLNTSCILYRTGFSTQNRDTMAALCIALSGASFLLDDKTMHQFSPNSAVLQKLNQSFTPHIGKSTDYSFVWTSELT